MTRSTLLTLLVTSVSLGGLHWGSEGIVPSSRLDSDHLVCTVHASKVALALGEYPSASVEIHNTGNHPVMLVGNLDGSSLRMRFPHAYFRVMGPPGGVETRGAEDCITLIQ